MKAPGLTVLYTVVPGIQWYLVAMPFALIFGLVIASVQGSGTGATVTTIQGVFLAAGAAQMIQIAFGHRLPLVVGPSAILLVALLASQDYPAAAVAGALAVCGAGAVLLAAAGLTGRIRRLFSINVIIVVLLLISFTLLPTIDMLIAGNSPDTFATLVFACILITVFFVVHRLLTGPLEVFRIVAAMAAGMVLSVIAFPYHDPFSGLPVLGCCSGTLFSGLSFEPVLIAAYIPAYLGVFANDIGAIESLKPLLRPVEGEGRLAHGVAATGAANIFAGLIGSVGVVNYSLSAGVIMATGSASRRPLCVSGVLMLATACSPLFIGFLASVPTVVTGCLLLYVLASQFAAALTLAPESGAVFDYSRGLVIGLPLLLGTMVAFLPAEAAASIPAAARPLLTNGFVVGFAAVILLEHVIMRRSQDKKHA